ncbi:MAG: DNA translocase FtsK 4TM domain-containing protein [Mariprofundaceae bacterium]|nr:DNA translocase FtsK 4TM domain-containing protein [Mariprofundaceae bacterium]
MSDSDKIEITPLIMREALAFLVFTCVVMVAVSLYSFNINDPSFNQATSVQAVNMLGTVGAWISDLMSQLCGLASWLFVLLGITWVVRMVGGYRPYSAGWTSFFWLPCVVAVSGLLHAHLTLEAAQTFAWGELPAGTGGALGALLVGSLSEPLYALGCDLVLIALMLSSFVIASHMSLLAVVQRIGLLLFWVLHRFAAVGSDLKARLQGNLQVRRERLEGKELRQRQKEVRPVEPEDRVEPDILQVASVKVSQRAQEEKQVELSLGTPSDSSFKLPSLSLFSPRRNTPHTYSGETLQVMSRMLEKKLLDYRVEGTIVAVQPGPVVVQFELEPAAGTKVSKVVSLQDDLARSMSAISVRVSGNIPGKNVIGIELPNESREMVVLYDVLSSTAFSDRKKILPLALGVDIAGQSVVVDLAKMPHLLVAGTTGSGKSVSVNTMICSLLMAHTPETLRLIMVDPKMLELSMYDDIPHLLVPVVTSPHKANKALAWAVFEMERRYKLMSEAKVRNLDGYNKQARKQEDGEILPFIVIIIDELADLMMVAGKEVELSICRLAQKARAAGLHLILATQRPSVDVITGLIKANLPSRLAFKVSSKIDSRTILDQMGAEQLLGMGDSLLMSGSTDLKRVHGAFVDDNEVITLVEYLKTQGSPDYKEEVFSMSLDDGEDAMGDGSGGGEKDEKYDEAAALVIEKGKCSVSMVQRYLRIGYNRASRIVEQMEEDGLVTPPGSGGSRKVLGGREGGVFE